MIIPRKLQRGDEIRVISPSSSMERLGGMKSLEQAKETLERLGFKVSFGKNILAHDRMNSASIQERIEDLHEAFSDKNIQAILTTIGGFNSNELLPYLDFELIKNNPKIFCGYSDITALNNAIFAKTGLVTYSGPGYSAFRMEELQEYQSNMWLRALTSESYTLEKSEFWSSDAWYIPGRPRHLFSNEWKVYNEGQAIGAVIGGNLSTILLLQGTPYFPTVEDPILFVEISEDSDKYDFARNLASLLQVVETPKALIIGRFPQESETSVEDLLYILDKYPMLKKIPVMYDLNFGHTQPIFTFSIGGVLEVDTCEKSLKVLNG